MCLKAFAVLALSCTVAAQNLLQALAAQQDLSTLVSLISQHNLNDTVQNLTNITVLAPSNEAIDAIQNTTIARQLRFEQGLFEALVNYSAIQGIYPSLGNLTFPQTLLTHSNLSNVTGGQVVGISSNGNNVTIISGLGSRSDVSSATPINFTGGVIFILDQILTIPDNFTYTSLSLNETAAVGAFMKSDVVETVNNTTNITIFVPNNAAFAAIGSAAAKLSKNDLDSLLRYHVVENQILFNTSLTNRTTLKTLEGANLTVTVEGNATFVNNAQIVSPNILIANGVLHVIDEVLNPKNTSAGPVNGKAEPAFSGASTLSTIPFTSGVTRPTSATASTTAM